jgi:hypothetical protein
MFSPGWGWFIRAYLTILYLFNPQSNKIYAVYVTDFPFVILDFLANRSAARHSQRYLQPVANFVPETFACYSAYYECV